MKLRAEFHMEPERVQSVAREMARRTGEPHRVQIEGSSCRAEWSYATGAPQDVMFLIGEIAAQGEGCLLEVKPVTR